MSRYTYDPDKRLFLKSAAKVALATFGIIAVRKSLAQIVNSPAFKGAAAPKASGGGSSCPADGSANVAVSTSGATQSTWTLGANTAYGRVGQRSWSDTVSRNICKLGFYVAKSAGDISGMTFTAAIYNVSGANLGSQIGSDSNAITGDNAWNGTWVRFPFASPVTVGASTTVSLVLKASAYTGPCIVLYNASTNTLNGNISFWDTSGVDQNDAAADTVMEWYYS